ncbi:conserved hypothetical protein [Sporisorium reilianum SRZ2]|uniref:RRM domain-containing protein n=1 Tax=Sporisorium reilianum (strain SRZ2) TaxID=999809 RepID=E6ZSG6_SPORE|nr:conserved hypothetical protein [Sporisorium reilianum SRZ2]
MARKQKKAAAAPAAVAATEATPAATSTPANFDSELDAFFKAAPPAPAPTTTTPSAASTSKAGPSSSKKRKAVEQQVEEEDSDDEAADEDNDDDDDDVEMEEGDGDLSSIDESLDDEGSLLYSQSEDKASDRERDDDDDDDEQDDNEPYVPPQHESVTQPQTAETAEPPKNRKKTFKEQPEPSELRDQRTLFIGNIPIEAAQSRSLQRKLISFIESFSPYPILTKAHALRFRSVAFSTPTVHLEEDEDEDDASSKKKKKGKAKERSHNYREAVAAVEGGENAQAPLTAQQKRKIAFINKDFHEKVKCVSAYVTIADPKAVLEHLYEIAPPKSKAKGASAANIQIDSRLTGPVLAALIASFADAQEFQGRHLRVDLVKSISPSEVLASGLEKVKTFDGILAGSSSSTVDPKSTLFVGGLDFEMDEEEVRAFFEALLVDELGPAGDAVTIPVTGLDGEPVPKSLLDSLSQEFPFVEPEKRNKVTESIVRNAEYVRSVRLIRDAATQMGKGFGYVRFVSQQCVDEVMALHTAEQAFLESVKGVKGSLGASAAIAQGGKEFKRRLKLKGRPIRVAYCKTQTKTSTPQARGKKNGAAQADAQQEPTTPQRKSPRYERSSGAPTPNGTSPHALGKRPRAAGATKIVPGSPSAARANPADIAKKAELYATLSKDQRKQMKKDDQERVDRRMAKKNKKLGAGAGVHKGKVDKSLLAEGEKAKSKERVKLRQPTAGAGAGGNGAKRFKSGGAQNGPPKRAPAKGAK